MAIIGFGFSKFDCERKENKAQKSIEINYNINIKEVSRTALNVGSKKEDVLKIDFGFIVMYGKGLGKIELVGDVVYTDTKEIIEETEKTWKKDKKLPNMVNEQVFKFIYNKATIKALELSDSLNLPSPIPLPKISFGENKK